MLWVVQLTEIKTKPFAHYTLLYAMAGSVYLHRCSGKPGSGVAYFYSHLKARILHSQRDNQLLRIIRQLASHTFVES